MQNHPKDNFLHLDLARGIAALMVMFGHLRSYLFVVPAEAPDASIIDKLFYFVTGFGREAVIIFFVLSGFFITKSIIGMVNRNEWAWQSYMINRLARLWTVLIPALILTLFWDKLGLALTSSEFYTGGFIDQYQRGPTPPEGIDLGVLTLLGNIFFVQIIETPVYGTNFPLWSLAYEFWYYVLFPLAFVPFVTKQSILSKVVHAVLFCILVYWLPTEVLLLGLVWLMGAVAFYVNSKGLFAGILRHPLTLVGAFLALGLVLLISRVNILQEGIVVDSLIGITFSLVVLGLVQRSLRPKIYEFVATRASNISYTLYVVHDSFLAFIACYFLQNKVVNVSIPYFLMFCGITIVYAAIIYWCFERNTYKVRAKMNDAYQSLVGAKT